MISCANQNNLRILPPPPEKSAQELAAKRIQEQIDQARRIEEAWQNIEKKYKSQETIQASASETIKLPAHEQELVFEIMGFKGYMPISQISTGYVSNINNYVGQQLTFRIVNISPSDHTMKLSARVVQDEEQKKRQEEARIKYEEEQRAFRRELEQLASKDYLQATVVSVQEKGIEVTLNDSCAGKTLQCWIHISQLADRFVSHPSEVVKTGDVIKAKPSLKDSGDEITLSIRAFEEAENKKRQEEIFFRLKEGSVVTGTIKKITQKIVFVDLGGVDGGIKISELSLGYVKDPHECVRIGEEIKAIVLRIDNETSRIDLSIKQYFAQELEEKRKQIRSSDDYQNINNSKLSFEGPLCLRLNTDRNPIEKKLNNLQESLECLTKLFPNISHIESKDKLETVLRSTFPDGFRSDLFVRNLTFEGANGNDNKVLALRPVLTPGCYLSSLLKTGYSLLFKGRVCGKEFVVDSIYETTDTEQLAYEAICHVTTFRDAAKITNNFLYDVLEQTASLTKHTSARLDEWEAYLQWKRTVAQQQIAGCKYYDLSFDSDRSCLIFETVFESMEQFRAFRKHLRSQDILAFNSNYSSEAWTFAFNENGDKRGRRPRGVKLGKFEGILLQGYLDNLPEGYTVPLSPEQESDLRSVIDTPYMARVAYELCDDDAEELASQNLEPEQEAEYANKNLLNNYQRQGFLALSAAGQFALLSRFDRAIGDLRNDQSKSPNLALWLFDATRARLPRPESSIPVDEWLNPGISGNENQKTAVQKMLDAPDLCLIQGPPGTGKTTVIAEAIYQMAKRGQRVLIASQSNDAVDNALDRLADTPQIRAIRLGQKNRRKNYLDGCAPHKYSEDEALRSYYASISSSLSSNWLDRWQSLDDATNEIDSDLRNAQLFDEDIAGLRQRKLSRTASLNGLQDELSAKNLELKELQEKNDTASHERQQLDALKALASGSLDDSVYLTNRQLKIVVPIISGCVNEAFEHGLLVLPTKLDSDTQNLNRAIEVAFSSTRTLFNLPEKLSQAKQGENTNDIKILERKRAEIQEKMFAAIDIEDEDAEMEWLRQLKSVKLELDQAKSGSGCVCLGATEKALFNEHLLESLESEDYSLIESLISEFLHSWKEAVDDAIRELEESLSFVDPSEFAQITESIKVISGKIKSEKAEIVALEEEIQDKLSTLAMLSEKYSSDSQDPGNVIGAIERAKSRNASTQKNQQTVRSTWEGVIRGFKNRLDCSETIEYDNDYFKRIYINACNVVGISCTDNMRNLDVRGFNAFDVVIIDEVSKATPPELLIPLMKARKAILVGDHRQLPPMFDEHEKSYTELISDQDSIPEDIRMLMTGENFTRFQRMVTSSLFKEYFESADESIKHSLLVQYRMHSDIMNIINRFYDGKLSAGLSSSAEKEIKAHNLELRGIDGGSFVVPDSHAYWIDTSSLPDGTPIYESFPGRSTSACNYLEIASIVELLKRMSDEYRKQGYGTGKKKTVGVISFYQSQVNELRRRFKSAKHSCDFSALDVDINTVDRFQGKEKSIIVVSLVRNNAQARASKHVVAFERINVAFSRAQEMLVIVGAKHMYENLKVDLPNMDTGEVREVPVYQYILEDLTLQGCLRSSNQLIGDTVAQEVLADFEKNRRKNEAR